MDAKGSGSEKEIPCCCLCGDVGFRDALLPCSQCTFRLQHTYCSRYYPEKIEKEKWCCEWCVHEKEQLKEGDNKKRKPIIISNGMTGIRVLEGKEEERAGPPGKNRGSKAVDRWRKLAKAARIGSAKRYKLLADVN